MVQEMGCLWLRQLGMKVPQQRGGRHAVLVGKVFLESHAARRAGSHRQVVATNSPDSDLSSDEPGKVLQR